MPSTTPSTIQQVYYSSTFVHLLFDHLDAQGLDAERLLGESRPADDGRGLKLYGGPHWRRLLERAAAALDDPLLGLKVGQRITPAHLGVLGYALLACPDGAAALLRWQQYERLIVHVAQMEVHAEGDSVLIEWQRAPELMGPLVDEVSLTALLQFARNITGGAAAVEEVCFVNPEPADLAPYRAYFGCPVRYGQPRTRLRFATSFLRLPLRQPDQALLAMMERQAGALLAALPAMDRLEQAVREAVARLARSGDVSLAEIASGLHLTPRTLHRRLAKLGLGFRALADDTRRRLAEDHLRDPRLSLAEVAWLLGYSEHSAFTRAFRRWTGTSPQQWRGRGAAA